MANDETLILEGKMSEVLSLMKKTFYSNKEIFLRELINNASEALDKIQFERLTNKNILNNELNIRLILNKDNKTLSIIDNGIGMTKVDLVDNLGVGFYSSYLVAHKVILTSKHNGHDQYICDSQPSVSFIVAKDINAQQFSRGTKITLFLKDDQLEYLEEATIKNIIIKHCQLITHPIYLWSENTKEHWNLINLWLRNQEIYKKIVGQNFGNHLPDDLAFSILFKLPLKSLKRFGCLCKSWALLFENSNFMNLFYINFISNQHSYYDDTSLLLCLNQHGNQDNYEFTIFSVSGKRFQDMEKLNWSNPFKEDGISGFILGSSSINGILCVGNNNIVYLWNPAVNELRVIPPSPVEYVPYYIQLLITYEGFGYDYVRDDYKVIRTVTFFENNNIEDWSDEGWGMLELWEIYSLRSNSWRKLKLNGSFPSSYGFNEKFYLEGMCHWIGFDDHNSEHYLASFDLSSEICYLTQTPMDIPVEVQDNFSTYMVERYLFILNGSIAFMSKYAYTTTFYISILGELGKKETWTKLFTLELFPCTLFPIGTTNMSNILFQDEDGQLVWFDLNTHVIEKLGVKVRNDICQIVVYKESLHPIKK